MGADSRWSQKGGEITGSVENSDDAERFRFGLIDNEVVGVRLHNPEPQIQGAQVFSRASGKRPIGKKLARPKDCCFNAISSFGIVLGYEVPNVEEIADSFRRYFILLHQLF